MTPLSPITEKSTLFSAVIRLSINFLFSASSEILFSTVYAYFLKGAKFRRGFQIVKHPDEI
jgi:hypothetical protein